VTTTRVIRDQVTNVLDYFVGAGLALYANPVSMSDETVSWHSPSAPSPFLVGYKHPTVDQYMAWVNAGEYSMALFDASLVQLTYRVEGGAVVGHRLAYIPCPYDVDTELLAEGVPIADLVESYRPAESAMRSPVRFDFDVRAAKPGHSAAHLTFNTNDCRIACVAPLHPLRFVDFVFRHFYPAFWTVHEDFFRVAAWQHIGDVTIEEGERDRVHVMWNVRAQAG